VLRALLRLVAAIDDPEETERFLRGLPAPARRMVEERWFWQAHDGQAEPAGDWRVWLIKAGAASARRGRRGMGVGRRRAGSRMRGSRWSAPRWTMCAR
jgi:hypothetical protein